MKFFKSSNCSQIKSERVWIYVEVCCLILRKDGTKEIKFCICCNCLVQYKAILDLKAFECRLFFKGFPCSLISHNFKEEERK